MGNMIQGKWGSVSLYLIDNERIVLSGGNMTIINIYQNKRNKHKILEIHNDGHYHNSVRQFLEWPNGVKNFTGDGILHRWKKQSLNELLIDYILISSNQLEGISGNTH